MRTYDNFASQQRDYNAEIYLAFGPSGDEVKLAVRETDPNLREQDVEKYVASLILAVTPAPESKSYPGQLAAKAIERHELYADAGEGLFSPQQIKIRGMTARALAILDEREARRDRAARDSTPIAVSRLNPPQRTTSLKWF